MKRNREKKKSGKWEISFAPISRCSAVFCALIFLIVLLGGGILSISRMRADTRASLAASHAQISQRVAGAVDLLEST